MVFVASGSMCRAAEVRVEPMQRLTRQCQTWILALDRRVLGEGFGLVLQETV